MIDPNTIKDFAVSAAILTPIDSGVVQVIKKMLPESAARFMPACSVAIGVGLGLLVVGANVTGAIVGTIIGLSATGLYEITKTTIAGK
jgi:hypothetical protein